MVSLPTSIGGPTATFVSTAGIYSPTVLSSESTHSNNDVGLGLGIGLGVGITPLAVVLGVKWLRRQPRHKRAAAALAYRRIQGGTTRGRLLQAQTRALRT